MSILKNYSDQSLVEGLRAGKESCFDELFLRYSSAIFKICRHYHLSQEESEEIVQDVFLKIWEKRTALNQHLSFKSYLYTIAKNQVLKEIRKNSQQMAYEKYAIYSTSEADTCTENQVFFDDLQMHSKKVINQLSSQRKEVFLMSRFEGLSNDEIATKLNLSKRTVEHHLYHAQKFIRDKMEVLKISSLLILFLLF